MKNLYLFTDSFPYGTKESFLEEEIKYLSKQDLKITLVPYSGDVKIRREVPPNVKVLKPISHGFKNIRRLFNFRVFPVLLWDLISNKVYQDKQKFRSWQIIYANANLLMNSWQLRNIKRELTKNDICYFYWGKGSNILAYFWKAKSKMVSRFHGDWDLWEDRPNGYAPIRKKIVSYLDYAIFISNKGESFFHSRYPSCKTKVFALGSPDNGERPVQDQKDIIRFVSCSAVYHIKRLPLIFRALNSYNGKRIEWTHIGDGVMFEELKQIIKNECNSNLKVNLIGRLKHPEVLNYYRTHYFDVFINLSMMEGIPVALMEATSFNIPVIATNVGSTSEAVSPTSGVLVGDNPTEEEIHKAIDKIISEKYEPRVYWNEHFNAERNYTKFANFLSDL